MPTPVSYLSGASLSNTVGMFKRGTIAQNLKPSLESGYRWWNGVEVTSSQYLIYSDTFTLGTTTQANATPVAYSTPDLTDQSLLNLINTLPPRIGQTAFTSLPIALQWLQSSNKFFLIRGGTENIVKSNLKLYVDAGRYNSYSGTGTNWVDLSGEGNNTTLINGTIYNSSGVASMYFDGTDDYVESINNLDLSGTNPRTYSVWVKIKTYLDNSGIIRTGTQGTASADMSLETTTTPGTFTFNGWATDFDFTVDSNFYGWHNLVIIYDGTKGLAYADGIFKNSLTFTSVAPNSKLQLGSDRKEGAVQGNNLDGFISNAMVYNRALSNTEILQNFNAQKYRFGYYDSVQDGLIFNLDAGNYLSYPRSGTTWTDLTGKGNNGTLTNGPTFSGGTTPSIVFDGSDDYVNCINNTNITGSKPSTMEITCEFTSLPLTFVNAMMQIGEGSGHGNFRLLYLRYVSGETPQPRLSVAWYDSGFETNFTPIQNQIYTFTYTDNGSNESKLYINGSLLTTYTSYTPLETNTNALYIGKFSYGGVLSGKVYNTKIYNRVLTPQEVIQNFESQRVNYGITGITTNGLVLNLDAANTASYNGSGTTWVDISGSEFDGTLINGPTYSNSGTSSSISFDGTDDYARVSDINTASEISIEGWVYANSVGSFNVIASQFKADTLESSWVLETVGSDIRLYITNNSLLSFASTSFSTLVWTYIVGTFNGTTIKIYKNSVLGDITGTIAGLNDSNLNINIGALYSQNGSEGGTGLWNGKIANVKIYNRALSQAEVLNNYNATKSRFGL